MSLADFLFELGQLKRVKRSGWWCAGVDEPESVAEHSHRAAAIAALLAELEGANPDRAALLAVFHDVAETRVNDQHRLGQRYFEPGAKDRLETRVIEDQTIGLPESLSTRLRAIRAEVRDRKTPEARIAKDADRLECLIQALEYRARGHDTDEWIRNAIDGLTTPAARSAAEECLARDPHAWWKERVQDGAPPDTET